MNELSSLGKPLLERYLDYASYNTQSKFNVKNGPSSIGQKKLLTQLKNELSELGLENIELNKQGVLTALLPANTKTQTTIGFITHLDSPPNFRNRDVMPEVIAQYRGGDISLGNGDEFISPVHYPFLQKLVGNTLIVSDGKNYLGLNKANIAEIMSMLAYLVEHNIPHHHIRVAFVPDRETGKGLKHLSLNHFNCDAIFYLENGPIGDVSINSFNIAEADISFYGKTSHLGYGKNRLQNALSLACEFQQKLPVLETPQCTHYQEGFFHLNQFSGNDEKVDLHFKICDFDELAFKQRQALLFSLVEEFNRTKKLPKNVTIKIKQTNQNIANLQLKHQFAQQLATKAMGNCGIKIKIVPYRSSSAFENLLYGETQNTSCLTLFCGGENLHSKQELITLEEMLLTLNILLALSQIHLS